METVSTKVPEDMKDELDDRAEEIGEARSVVIRYLLRDAMAEDEDEEDEEPDEDGGVPAHDLAIIFGGFSTVLAVNGDPAGWVLPASVILLAVGLYLRLDEDRE